jgi:hypothetical protein
MDHPDFTLCWNWQSAPYNCGGVNRQVTRGANGEIVNTYLCTFCAEQLRLERAKLEQKPVASAS